MTAIVAATPSEPDAVEPALLEPVVLRDDASTQCGVRWNAGRIPCPLREHGHPVPYCRERLVALPRNSGRVGKVPKSKIDLSAAVRKQRKEVRENACTILIAVCNVGQIPSRETPDSQLGSRWPSAREPVAHVLHAAGEPVACREGGEHLPSLTTAARGGTGMRRCERRSIHGRVDVARFHLAWRHGGVDHAAGLAFDHVPDFGHGRKSAVRGRRPQQQAGRKGVRWVPAARVMGAPAQAPEEFRWAGNPKAPVQRSRDTGPYSVPSADRTRPQGTEVVMTTAMQTEIRPFTVRFPTPNSTSYAAASARRRVGATKWPTEELIDDRSQVRNASRSLR